MLFLFIFSHLLPFKLSSCLSLGSLSLSLSFFRSSSLICLYHSMYAGLFFLSRSSCQILYMKKSNHISHLLTWHSITNIIFAHIYTDRARVNGCIRAKMKKKEEETWENERKKNPQNLYYMCVITFLPFDIHFCFELNWLAIQTTTTLTPENMLHEIFSNIGPPYIFTIK